MTVQLSRRHTSIVVALVDRSGFASQRTVAHASEAVSIIESWLRPDLEADLLAGFTVEPRTVSSPPAVTMRAAPPPVAPPAAQARRPAITEATTLSAAPMLVRPPASQSTSSIAVSAGVTSGGVDGLRGRRRDPVTVSVVGELAVDQTSTWWYGGAATACFAIGRLCAGMTGEYRTTETLERTRSQRALLVGAELPLAFGRLVVSPGVAVGIASTSWHARNSETDEDQPMDGVERGARFDARLVASYPLGRFMRIDAALGVATSSGADGDDEHAASPARLVRFGLGLRVGAP